MGSIGQVYCLVGPMDRVNYETYDTDTVYDDMEGTSGAHKVPDTMMPQPSPRMENKSSNKKIIILLLVVILLLLLVIGGVVGLMFKKDLEEVEEADCDVGPWGPWTSCYLPPFTCGIGKQNRTRDKISDAEGNGLKCAKLRIIELAQIISCNVACKLPVDCEVGEWGSWTSCSANCGEGTKERTREKIAEAENNGTECASTRKMIPLKETNTCNGANCTSLVHGTTVIHTADGYRYYKVKFLPGTSITESAVATTCEGVNLKAVCSGPTDCQYTDTTKCMVTKLSTDCSNPLKPLSKAICSGSGPADCPEIDGVFSYLKGYFRGPCGVLDGEYCTWGPQQVSTEEKPLFAYCAGTA